jgi:hypothetical protein
MLSDRRQLLGTQRVELQEAGYVENGYRQKNGYDVLVDSLDSHRVMTPTTIMPADDTPDDHDQPA